VVELPWAADRTVVRASVEAANRVTTNCCVRDGVVQMVSMLRGGRGWRGGAAGSGTHWRSCTVRSSVCGTMGVRTIPLLA
jgi:hypothetical protein